MMSAKLHLNLKLVQPPLLLWSLFDWAHRAVSSQSGETLYGTLGFYNWNMTRMQTFYLSDFRKCDVFTSQMLNKGIEMRVLQVKHKTHVAVKECSVSVAALQVSWTVLWLSAGVNNIYYIYFSRLQVRCIEKSMSNNISFKYKFLSINRLEKPGTTST